MWGRKADQFMVAGRQSRGRVREEGQGLDTDPKSPSTKHQTVLPFLLPMMLLPKLGLWSLGS